MSTLKVTAITDTSGGNTTTINSMTPTADSLRGFRNRLINGSYALDQRNAGASTAVADDVYCFDRWYVLTETASVNVSQQTNQEDGLPFNIRLTQNQSSAQRMGLAQIIESSNCRDLRGSSVVLNIRMRASASQAIRYAILEWTGTADSVTSDVVNSWTNTTYTAGQFFISTTTTVTAVGSITPSANTWTSLSVPLTGTIGSTTNNITVFVWTEGTAAQNFTLDLANAQLEAGSTATPFERRPYGTELMLCQRYLPAYLGSSLSVQYQGQAYSTTAAYITIPHFVTTRVAPTGITTSSMSAVITKSDGSGATITNLAFTQAGVSSTVVNATGASGLTAGNASILIFNSGTLLLTGCEL